MMQVFSSEQAAQTLAQNRAQGAIALDVCVESGRTRRQRVHESGSLRVRFPNAGPDRLDAVLVNTAGGMTGGDRFAVRVTAGAGARACVTTTAAEKIYRSLGPDAEVSVSLRVENGARLLWLPQESILFEAARLSRHIDVELMEGGALVMAEAVVFGRAAMGERAASGRCIDRWRVRCAGRLAFADTLRLEDKIADTLAQAAAAAGASALATLLILPGTDAQVERVRAAAGAFAGEWGASCWNGLAAVRFCAMNSAVLRHDLLIALAALDVSPPRTWLN